MNDKYYENGHEENDGFVALTGEDGNVEKFYHVGTIDFKDDWYVFFSLPSRKTESIPTNWLCLNFRETKETRRCFP